jgi:hypothetical protein
MFLIASARIVALQFLRYVIAVLLSGSLVFLTFSCAWDLSGQTSQKKSGRDPRMPIEWQESVKRHGFSGPEKVDERAWPLKLPANTWVVREVPPFPGSPGPDYSKHMRLAYDSDRHLIYMWGGDYCVANPIDGSRCASHEEFWSYDVAVDRWQLLLDQSAAVSPGFPRGRCVSGFTYDPKRKVVWMTSGQERYQTYHLNLQSGGLWNFDPALRTWARVGPSPAEAGVFTYEDAAHFIAYDTVNDGILVPDGRNAKMHLFQSGSWTSVPTVADPWIQEQNSIHAIDTKRNRMILYSAGRGETWSYDFATKKSALLKQQKLPPQANFSMVYDSVNDVVALFGGGTVFDPDLNDLWIFDFNKHAWRKPILEGNIPSARHSQIAFDPHHNAIVLYGERIFLLRLDLPKGK